MKRACGRLALAYLLMFATGAAGCESKSTTEPPQSSPTVGHDEPAAKSAPDPRRDAAPAEQDVGPNGPDTYCEKAYEDTKKLLEGLQETLDEKQDEPDQPVDLPPPTEWIPRCRKLPLKLQKCLSIEYAVPHKAECQEAQQNLAPDQKRKLEELMAR